LLGNIILNDSKDTFFVLHYTLVYTVSFPTKLFPITFGIDIILILPLSLISIGFRLKLLRGVEE